MRRNQFLRRVAAASAAAVVLVTLTACNDEPTAADIGTETSESAEPSESAESPPSEPEDTAPAEGESVDPAAFVDDVLGGLVDATTAHLTLEMEGGPSAMTAEGDVDYSTTPPSMSMTMTRPQLGDGTIGMRLVDGVMYLQLAELGSGKWMKFDLGGKDSPLGEDFADQMDPGAAIDAIKGAVDSVTYLGDEEVDGESLHHYTMSVRTEAVRDLEHQFGGPGGLDLPRVIEYDVWTDGDGMLRRMTMSLGEAGSVTMTLSAWGEPVDIEAPPASEVMELPSGLTAMG